MAARRFDTNMQKTITAEYQTGVGLRELARKYGCDRDAIATALHRQGVAVRRVKNNLRYEFDIHAFDEFDEQTCYWLGFLYADGCMNKDRSIILGLQRRDHSHLEKFKEFMKSNAPVKDVMNNIGKKQYPRSVFIITNIYFGKRFSELGMNPKEPEQAFQSIPYKQHWIRGLLDGDGCVYKNPDGGINFMGELALMKLIHMHLVEIGADSNPGRNIQAHTKSNVYYLHYSGRNVATKVLDYLYQDATIWLERKRETFERWPKPTPRKRNHLGQWA